MAVMVTPEMRMQAAAAFAEYVRRLALAAFDGSVTFFMRDGVVQATVNCSQRDVQWATKNGGNSTRRAIRETGGT